MDDFLTLILELARSLVLERFCTPPVDPYAIAEGLSITIEESEGAPRWNIRRGRATIGLPAGVPAERLRFTVAHEVLEIEVRRRDLLIDIDPGLVEYAERVFQVGAAEMLMPRRWYADLGSRSGWDLAHLREAFDVSWEAAARRVPVCTPSACAIVDNGHLTVRIAGEDMNIPSRLAGEEREAVDGVYDAWPSADPVHASGPGFRCSAWPALPERSSIRRVCLLTFPADDW